MTSQSQSCFTKKVSNDSPIKVREGAELEVHADSTEHDPNTMLLTVWARKTAHVTGYPIIGAGTSNGVVVEFADLFAPNLARLTPTERNGVLSDTIKNASLFVNEGIGLSCELDFGHGDRYFVPLWICNSGPYQFTYLTRFLIIGEFDMARLKAIFKQTRPMN